MTERTYTESEVKATIALFAQQVAEHCRVGIKAGPDDPSSLIEKGACSCGNLIANGVTPWKDLWREHILSLVPDPSALAAHDAALRETFASRHSSRTNFISASKH